MLFALNGNFLALQTRISIFDFAWMVFSFACFATSGSKIIIKSEKHCLQENKIESNNIGSDKIELNKIEFNIGIIDLKFIG